MRHRSALWSVAATAASVGLVVASCGNGKHLTLADLTGPTAASSTTSTTAAPTTFPSLSTTTPAAPTTTASDGTSTPPSTAMWVPATGNLAGMPSECGNISLVSARPDRDTVIASVSLHGLWASSNGDDAWAALGQAGGAPIGNRGSTMVYDPQHPETFWESGIYNGGGVYRTDDDGATFHQLGDITHVDALSVDLSDPNRRTLIAGLHEQTAVQRSHDGGQTWAKISGTLPPDIGFTSSLLVVDSRTFLVGTNTSQNAGVFRTTDDGATWTQVFKGAVTGQPLVTKAGKLFWVTAADGGIIGSADGGVTWGQAARGGTVDTDAPDLVELPSGAIAAVGNLAIITTKDEGRSWTKASPTMPYRPKGITFSPTRQAFYIWYFTCDPQGNNAVPPDAIMRLDLSSH